MTGRQGDGERAAEVTGRRGDTAIPKSPIARSPRLLVANSPLSPPTPARHCRSTPYTVLLVTKLFPMVLIKR